MLFQFSDDFRGRDAVRRRGCAARAASSGLLRRRLASNIFLGTIYRLHKAHKLTIRKTNLRRTVFSFKIIATYHMNFRPVSTYTLMCPDNLTMHSTKPRLRVSHLLCILCVLSRVSVAVDLRIGIIGCDTSHVPAFTENLNNPSAKDHILGGKVVAAFKGGSADIPESANRVENYAKTLKEKYGVRFYDSIEELCQNVDAVLVESVDGRPHLEQIKPVIKAGKPVFIDKPMAGSLKDVVEIFRLAKEAKVPVFSSSALRFAKDTQAVHHGSIGKVAYVETYGPCEIEKHHPDLFWYGVHGVEAMFTVLGPGCETVQRGATPDGKIEVTGTWKNGAKGIYREDKKFHGLAKGEKGEASAGSFDGYVPLVVEIMKFLQTGEAPVSPQETIEIFAFMEAADESKAKGGAPIRISDILAKASKH